MTAKDLITQFVASPRFHEFFGFENYNPSYDAFPTLNWYTQTFLAEHVVELVIVPKQLHYVADSQLFKIYGPVPLTAREVVYLVYVTSFLFFKNPSASVSETWLRMHCTKQFPQEVEDFLEILQTLNN